MVGFRLTACIVVGLVTWQGRILGLYRGGGEKIVGSVIRQSNPFPELQEKDTMYNLFEAFSLPVCRLHSF